MSRLSPFQRIMSVLSAIAMVAGIVHMSPIPATPAALAADGNAASYELSVDPSNNPVSTTTAAIESRSVTVGQTFPVNVLVNTDGASFDAGEFVLNWNPAQFDLVTDAGTVIPNGVFAPLGAAQDPYKGTSEQLLQGSSIFGSGTITVAAGSVTVAYASDPSNTDPQIYSPTDSAATVNPNGAFPGTDRLVTFYFEAKTPLAPAAGVDNIFFSQTGGVFTTNDIAQYGDWTGLGTASQSDFYIHAGAGDVVAVGDTRLTGVGAFSSPVVGTDSDATGAPALLDFPATDDAKFRDADTDTNYDTGEVVYADMDDSDTVTIGDIRITRVGTSFAAGSTVAAANSDIGGALADFPATDDAKFRDADAGADYDTGEFVYIDMDDSDTVTAGDLRLSDIFAPGSIVAANNFDIGTDVNPGSASDVRYVDTNASGTFQTTESVYQNLDYPNTTSTTGDLRVKVAGQTEGSALLATDAAELNLPLVRLANVRQSGTGGSGDNILSLTDGVSITATAANATTRIEPVSQCVAPGGAGATVTVYVFTSGGAPIAGLPVTLAKDSGTDGATINGQPGPVSVNTNANGEAVFTIVNPIAPANPLGYVATFTPPAGTLQTLRTQVRFDATCTNPTSVTLAGPACVVTGTNATVTATNNGVSEPPATTLTQGSGTSSISTATYAGNNATFTVSSATAQTVTYTAVSNGSVTSNTLQVQFAASCAGPQVPTSLVLVPSTACVSPTGVAQTLTYEVRDASNVNITNAAVGPFTFTGTNSPAVTAAAPSTPTTATGFTVSVTAPAGSTGSRTFTVPVTASGGSAVTLSGTIPVCVVAVPTSVSLAPACVANTGTLATVTATVRDANGAIVPISAASITSAAPTGVTYGTPALGAASSGTFTYSLTAANTAAINASQAIAFSVTPTGGSATALNTTYQVAASCTNVPSTLVLTSPACIPNTNVSTPVTFTVTNTGGTPAANAAVSNVTVAGTPAITVSGVSATTSATGTFTANLTAPTTVTAGSTRSVSATIAGASQPLTANLPICAASTAPTIALAPACFVLPSIASTVPTTLLTATNNGAASANGAYSGLSISGSPSILGSTPASGTLNANGQLTVGLSLTPTTATGSRTLSIIVPGSTTPLTSTISIVASTGTCGTTGTGVLAGTTKTATDGDELFAPGDTVDYTIRIPNSGTTTVSDVSVLDRWTPTDAFDGQPSSVTVSPNSGTNTVSASQLQINNLSVANGASTTITYEHDLLDEDDLLEAFDIDTDADGDDAIFWASEVEGSSIVSSGNDHRTANDALDASDDDFVSLGGSNNAATRDTVVLGDLNTSSYLIVGFDDRAIVNADGDDLRINEIDGDDAGDEDGSDEEYAVYASQDGITYEMIEEGLSDSASLDLDDADLDWAIRILIVDTTDDNDADGDAPGTDIESVQILNLGLAVENTATVTSASANSNATAVERIVVDISDLFDDVARTPSSENSRLETGDPCYLTGRDQNQGGQLTFTLRDTENDVMAGTQVLVTVVPSSTIQVGGRDAGDQVAYTTDANGQLAVHFTSQIAQDSTIRFEVRDEDGLLVNVVTHTGRFRASCELPRTGAGTVAGLMAIAAIPAAYLTRRRSLAAAKQRISS